MSDIFISYSKSDRELALKLSAYLESEGWSVWWDKSLGAGDAYRDEIMKQLAAVRAVIVIWTKNSIKSDWVRAEAGRAKADGKLIPVKTPSLTYADIPLPFAEMHTENVSSLALIRAAVVAQLTKPSIPVSALRELVSTFRFQILTWIGIVGAALTLFTNVSAVLTLAEWAKILVSYWHGALAAFWLWLGPWIGLHIPKEYTPALSFTVFASMMVIGINFSSKTTAKSRNFNDYLAPVANVGDLLAGGNIGGRYPRSVHVGNSPERLCWRFMETFRWRHRAQSESAEK
jgi:TIR domain